MSGVVTALGTVGVVVLVGWALARFRVLGQDATEVLARVTFVVAIPALLVVTLARADLHVLLSRTAVVTVAATSLVALLSAAHLRVVLRRSAQDVAIGTLAATYLNAVHLGIPIAVYVVGDAVAVVPTLLFQQLVLAPVAFAVLGSAGSGGAGERGVRAGAVRTLRNPVLVATLVGLALAVVPWRLPEAVFAPLSMLGAAAAPMALVAFGMSLAGRARRTRRPSADLVSVAVVRAVVHPVVTWLLARYLGLDPAATLAVIAMAALPTAQNVLVFALRYRRGVALARDAGVVTTLLAVPVILAVAATLA